MPRLVTLYSLQWGDLSLEEVCIKAKEFGYDGIEIGLPDHLDVRQKDPSYYQEIKGLLNKYGMELRTISSHLVGQAVCDQIDERHKSILPDYYERVITTRELIEHKKMSVSEACKLNDISRSTYYKYKDHLFLPSKELGKKVLLAFVLQDQKGVLSNVLNFVAEMHGNIIAINQEMPINNSAYVTLTVDIVELDVSLDVLLDNLRKMTGVNRAELIAVE